MELEALQETNKTVREKGTPRSLIHDWHHRATDLDVITDPLPLVAEIRSPSTGGIVIAEKLPVYQARGDLEI